MRGSTLCEESIDNVQEPLEVTILEIVSYRDECDWNTRRHTDGVLYVQVLHVDQNSIQGNKIRTHSLDTSLCGTLRVRATIQGL